MLVRSFAACLVVGFAASFSAWADDADVKKAAKAKATESTNALLKGEYETFVDLTHPRVVEGSGGRKKMTEKLAAEMKVMKAKGFVFKSVALGDPSEPVRAGKELYIAIPFTLEITAPDGRLTTKSTLIGISSDGGKMWVFVDANPGRDALKKVFPDLPEKLVIPKKEPPVFTKD